MKRVKGLRKLPDLSSREREIVALRANGFELREIAKEYAKPIPKDLDRAEQKDLARAEQKELDKAEQTVKNVSRRARQKWSADDDEAKMTPDRFLALAIVTGEIVWDRSVGKFVPLDELG